MAAADGSAMRCGARKSARQRSVSLRRWPDFRFMDVSMTRLGTAEQCKGGNAGQN
jgi:hypothetical protein